MEGNPRDTAIQNPQHKRESAVGCMKCGSKAFTTGEIRATGGFWTKLFGVQSERYISKSCKRCGFTEFYKADSTTGSDVVDFLFGN